MTRVCLSSMSESKLGPQSALCCRGTAYWSSCEGMRALGWGVFARVPYVLQCGEHRLELPLACLIILLVHSDFCSLTKSAAYMTRWGCMPHAVGGRRSVKVPS